VTAAAWVHRLTLFEQDGCGPLCCFWSKRAKNWFRGLGRGLSEGSAGVCVCLCLCVSGKCLDPLPHMPGVFTVKVLLDALLVFALGLFHAFL